MTFSTLSFIKPVCCRLKCGLNIVVMMVKLNVNLEVHIGN